MFISSMQICSTSVQSDVAARAIQLLRCECMVDVRLDSHRVHRIRGNHLKMLNT